ncbi:MAG: hypothetical protein FIB01_10830 [Gemmatimonadetes bacterium]|nr:hypothetical protein [Gemmatimonadota bacterium]
MHPRRQYGLLAHAPAAAYPERMGAFFRVTWNSLRRHVRQLWLSHGGGYYGLVTALTFCYLEVVGIAADLRGITYGALNLGWVISFVIGNIVNAVINALLAAIWPLHWIGQFGVGFKLLAWLGATYVLYLATRPLILHLLAADDVAEITAPARGSRSIPPGG